MLLLVVGRLKENGGYLLPVKAAVRKAEGLIAGDEVTVRLVY